MAAQMVARVPDREAAARVTDYFNDDGIDAFAVTGPDSASPAIYLVQAKWSAKGTHSFNNSETTKLLEGFTRLQEGQLHPDNLLHKFRPEIDRVMTTPNTRVVLVFATSGHEKVSPSTRASIDQAVARLSKNEIAVECRYLLLQDFVSELEAGVARRGVTVSAPLLRNRPVDERYPALQGTISAAELGQWYVDHSRAIFDDNVRVEMDSDVNNEIVHCLLNEPENFWYFNNGVTALCERWSRALTNGREVPYHFEGLRIVNGAQTVSSIGRAMLHDPEAVAKAQVPIRFVALDTEGPRFGAKIAYATNRANPMRPRDFLAMDHVQQRLHDEFALTWGREYAIRANDYVPTGDEGCSVLEAVIAMACGRQDVITLAEAKNDISCMWHTQGERYRRLFNDHTSAVEVWRRVQTLRMTMAFLRQEDILARERDKTVAVLGDLLIAHVVFQRLGDDGIDDVRSDWEDRWSHLATHTVQTLRALVSRVDSALTSAPMSRNKCKMVAKLLLRDRKWISRQIELILLDHAGILISEQKHRSDAPWPSEPRFLLPIRGNQRAEGRRCDDGFLVHAGSLAAVADQSSLSTPQLRHRGNLRNSLGFVERDGFLQLTRDMLFESPSQAAAVLLGHNVNGADGWRTTDGRTYNQVVREEK
jgi:hypothetical protein